MAKTNFSGPITTGPIQVNTGSTIGENVRDAAFVTNTMAFPLVYTSFVVTTDANKLAVTGSNGAGTTSVTLLDTTQNVPGITAVGGFEMASKITLTSSGNDSGLAATITGTDVNGYAQTEVIAAMGNAGVVSSAKTYKTVTAIDVSGAGTVGNLEVGVLNTNEVTVPLRSLFNSSPLSQTSTTQGKNLANNIVIPPFSRIIDISLIVTTAFDQNTFMQLGANVAQAAGATLNSFDPDYFAGRSATTDVKALGRRSIPVDFYQTTAQQKNCLNVSDDDAAGFEIDKALSLTVNSAATLGAGNAVLFCSWLQRANDAN